jgi:hypothetical protein
MADEDRQPDEKSPAELMADAEGDAIDRSSLPDGLNGNPDISPEPEPTPEPEPAKTTVVSIGGRTFEVPLEVAEAYAQENARQPEPEPRPTPEDSSSDWDDIWYSDPKAAAERIRQETVQAVRQEYAQEQAKQQFWNDFYTENPSLKGRDSFVQTVMREEWSQLQNMSSGKATRDRLAEMTKTRILDLVSEFRPREVPNDTSLETGSGPGPVQPQASEPPASLSNLIRERRSKRG